MATKYVFFFGNGKAEGDPSRRDLLGGKGAGLARMTQIGLPVPPGFTISTVCCRHYFEKGRRWPPGLDRQVQAAVRKLEHAAGRRLGDPDNPLLVSVRSGAAVSMPGMMETILNLGLNDACVEGLARATGNRRFAMDSYRRLIMMYGSTARGIERGLFEEAFEEIKETRTRRRLGAPPDQPITDTDVDADELALLVERFKDIYQRHTGEPFPQEPMEQLTGAINAVFESWNAEKAVTYRRVEGISGLIGTAVNVQQMVFGNMGDDSGTGVCFTRNPSTGENEFWGEVLFNAQGEDVVAGIRTPLALSELRRIMPDIYRQLEAVRAIIEPEYGDMQDLEFTIERGRLYVLQCRSGKRTPQAAFRIAVEQATRPFMSRRALRPLVQAGLLTRAQAEAAARPVITRAQAVRRIRAEDVLRLFFPRINPQTPAEELARRRLTRGINAVPGAAVGRIVFTAADAEAWAQRGEKVILVRTETSPEDVGGMHAAQGILTSTGGKTSHAAVVALGWGKCCIVGAEELKIDERARRASVNGRLLREGDVVTLDGETGTVYEGALELIDPVVPREFTTLMGWCDRFRRLGVRANADTPEDAARAVSLGAEGIGLCRTEHMFFATTERRTAIQQMILAADSEERREALEHLLPFQREDFIGIFEAMKGRPVTIRLIDPPLHEFIPHDEEGIHGLADRLVRADRTTWLRRWRQTLTPPRAEMDTLARSRFQRGWEEMDESQREQVRAMWRDNQSCDDAQLREFVHEQIRRRAAALREANPMLGHRGCRLCITYPEILDMQVRAIMEAAVAVQRRNVRVLPEIMIPLSIDARELALLTTRTRQVADEVLRQHGARVRYLVGTMIETPRAALLADGLARTCEFFSFGTNDLTQTTMALSRDDAGRFLPAYLDPANGPIFPADPFATLDREGVGLLVRVGVAKGRAARRDLKIGICGEHGGDAQSVRFCHAVGMDYVSCSPLRVPVARLAAAQAVLEEREAATPRRAAASRRGAAGRSTNRRPAGARISATARRRRASGKPATRATRKKRAAR